MSELTERLRDEARQSLAVELQYRPDANTRLEEIVYWQAADEIDRLTAELSDWKDVANTYTIERDKEHARAEAAIAAYKSALKSQGYVVAPTEPTEKMTMVCDVEQENGAICMAKNGRAGFCLRCGCHVAYDTAP